MVTKEEKIEELVSELDEQVDNIKQFSKVLDHINKLLQDVQGLSDQVLEGSEKYINVTTRLEKSLVTIEEHIESVAKASEFRFDTLQNESLVKYKKMLGETVHIIRESEGKLIASNSSVTKQVEYSQSHIILAVKEESDKVNKRLLDMEGTLLAAQSRLGDSNKSNTSKLIKVISVATLIIGATIIATGFFLQAKI